MRAERLEASGLKTAGGLFKGLSDSGISSRITSALYNHEKAHADADEERRGEFGFAVSGGWVVAYYVIQGERTPEQLMKIAIAPGTANMSRQDWAVYNYAWRLLLREVQEEKYKENNDTDNKTELSWDELRDSLVEKLSHKLNKLSDEERFPDLQELLGYEFGDLMRDFGLLIYRAYTEAIAEVKSFIPEIILSGAENSQDL